MSSDDTSNGPAPLTSREAVREKAKQVTAQQKRVRILRRAIIGTVAAVAVGAIALAVTWTVTGAVSKPELTPAGLQDDGILVHDIPTAATTQAVPEGTPEASGAGETTAPDATPTADPEATPPTGAVDVHIYVDYLTPQSGEFERANARQLSTWISEGAVTVTYHPVSLLTANSNGTKYSLRSAAASACVATYAPESFYAYNHELLTSQPAVDSDGRSDVELADLAGAVGIDNITTVRSCIEGGDYIAWARDATARALEGPLPGSKDLMLTGAPMIVVNGEPYVGSMKDAAEFSQFVLTAASDSYYGNPTPTPGVEDVPPAPEPTPTPAE